MSRSPVDAAAQSGAQRERALTSRGDGRKKRWGVVHTPVEVARFAMARVDILLQTHLGLQQGLASPEVGIVDPSVGTGVWLAAALERGEGRATAPRRMLGLDRDGAALDLAEAAVGSAARQQKWPCTLRQVNSLSLYRAFEKTPPVAVVVGNPPWASRSDSRDVEPTSEWLSDFKRDGRGAALGERRVGVLSDDYVRFVRWAAEQARQAPRAVVCLVTNHSFFDGPVHRGMRARLREWFDVIEAVDLGGNALLSRDGGRDENVFGVRPGAAITWMLRTGRERALATVAFSRLRGTVGDKLAALDPQADALEALELADAEAPWRMPSVEASGVAMTWPAGALAIDDAMPFHREGVQTNRDAFATAASRELLMARMQAFVACAPGPKALAHFDPERARARLRDALRDDPEGRTWIAPLAYRPFEHRYVVTLPEVAHRPRPALLRAAADAVCLLSSRKDRGERPWSLWGASLGVADGCFLSTRSSCRTRVFPARNADGGANLEGVALAKWLSGSGISMATPSAETFVALALAQLASTEYRRRFGACLRDGFPRLLPPRSERAVEALCAAGRGVLDALVAPAPPASASTRTLAPPDAVARAGVGHFGAPGAPTWVTLGDAQQRQWARYAKALAEVDTLWSAASTLFAI